MARSVWHRWNDDSDRAPGAGLPTAGDVIYGPRNRWRVLEVIPVESRRWANAWRARLEPLGPHGLDDAGIDRVLRPGVWRYLPTPDDETGA